MNELIKAHGIALKTLKAIAEEDSLAGAYAKNALEQIKALMVPEPNLIPIPKLSDELEEALGQGRR